MAIYMPMPLARRMLGVTSGVSAIQSCHDEDVKEVRELVEKLVRYQLDSEQIPNRMLVFEEYQLVKNPEVKYTREQTELFDRYRHHWQPGTQRQLMMSLRLQNAFLDGVREVCPYKAVAISQAYTVEIKPHISRMTFTTYFTPRFA